MNESKDKFNQILDESINALRKGLINEVDAYLINDIKRMGELGILQIQSYQPEFTPFNAMDSKILVSQKVRLYFKGEETIESLREQLDAYKDVINVFESQFKDSGNDLYLTVIKNLKNQLKNF